jgi:hypothetical protein
MGCIPKCLLKLKAALSDELLDGCFLQMRLGVDDYCLKAAH